jgi:hypothetical protein
MMVRRMFSAKTAVGVFVFALFSIFFVAVSVSAFEEPSGFKEVKFGDSEAVVRSKLRIPSAADCHSMEKSRRWEGERFCARGDKIGDVQVKATYVFRSDKLVHIALTFRPESFTAIKDAFLSRFGRPSKIETRPVRTRAGSDQDEELTWAGGTMTIVLTKHVMFEKASATYELLSESSKRSLLLHEEEWKKEDAKKKAAEDRKRDLK